MKDYFILITLIFISLQNFISANEYILESSASLNSKSIQVDKDFKFRNVDVEIRWTDSLGEYGKGECLGYFLEEKSNVDVRVFCEYIDSKNDKFWTLLKRESNEVKSGIGKTIYLNGTGKYSQFRGYNV